MLKGSHKNKKTLCGRDYTKTYDVSEGGSAGPGERGEGSGGKAKAAPGVPWAGEGEKWLVIIRSSNVVP